MGMKAKNECGTTQKTPFSSKWSKPSFLKNRLEGEYPTKGGRGTTTTSKVGTRKVARLSSPTIQSDSNICVTTTFAGNVGIGKSSNHTPIKRKLLEIRPVQNLVSKFELPDKTPNFSHHGSLGCSESPAKRQKVHPGVNQPNSQERD